MKSILLHGLLFAVPIVSYCQKAKDPAKEKNDLIALKQQVVQQSASLKADVDQEQTLLDSLSKKIAADSAELVEIKKEDAGGTHKSHIKNNEKQLQHFRDQVAQLNKELNTQRAQLKDAADLIKELDAEIKKAQ